MIGTAYLDVSADVLRRGLLLLPTDCEIIGSLESAGEGVVRLLVSGRDVPTHALQVSALCRSIHGVAVFDRFEVIRSREMVAA